MVLEMMVAEIVTAAVVEASVAATRFYMKSSTLLFWMSM
jgi:hypothetical protein